MAGRLPGEPGTPAPALPHDPQLSDSLYASANSSAASLARTRTRAACPDFLSIARQSNAGGATGVNEPSLLTSSQPAAPALWKESWDAPLMSMSKRNGM